MYAMKLDLVLKRMIFNLMTELKIELPPPPRKKKKKLWSNIEIFLFSFLSCYCKILTFSVPFKIKTYFHFHPSNAYQALVRVLSPNLAFIDPNVSRSLTNENIVNDRHIALFYHTLDSVSVKRWTQTGSKGDPNCSP